MKTKIGRLKNYNVVRSKLGNYLVRAIGQEIEGDTYITGPFAYEVATDRRDELKAKAKASTTETDLLYLELKGPFSLQLLIQKLDKFTQADMEKVFRGDANSALRRKGKNLALKLGAAAVKTGMEAAQVKPVKAGDQQTAGWIKAIKGQSK